MEHGCLWNSNSFSHDLPFRWESGGKVLVELPRQPFGDGRTYQHSNNDAGNPENALIVWKGMFDEFHEESAHTPGYCRSNSTPTFPAGPAAARRCAPSFGT